MPYILQQLWYNMLSWHYATTTIRYVTMCCLSTILQLRYAFTPYATTTLDMPSFHYATTYLYSVLLQL